MAKKREKEQQTEIHFSGTTPTLQIPKKINNIIVKYNSDNSITEQSLTSWLIV